MDFQKEIKIYFSARYPLIAVVSREEGRIVEDIRLACEQTQRQLLTWDLADFFKSHTKGLSAPKDIKDPLSALEKIEQLEGKAVIVLPDFHQCWHLTPKVIRKLRNLAQSLKSSEKNIVVTMPTSQIPEELKDDMVIVDFVLPHVEELDAILKQITQTNKSVDLTFTGRQKLLQAALGLSSNQALRIFSKVLSSNGIIDFRAIDMVNAEKKQIIRESGALEFFAPSELFNDVGGLEVLKEWLRTRELAFGKEAQDYGLPSPKGILLMGIPGTGKSLTAKTIAGLWRLPLIRLDVGALFGGLVGQSEENTRHALKLAETVSPCILWIDEIEKGLSTGGGDGGTSLRVFGSILSWMQEKTKPVFVVATANNISLLPPELLRKGRIDEIFYLDLPTFKERKEIFEVHLRKRKRFVTDYNLEKLAKVSEGYVGAEIEQSVIDAMFIAFSDKKDPSREFRTDDIVEALTKMVPLSRSQSDAIDELRRWLDEGRVKSASFGGKQQAQAHFVKINLSKN